MTAIIYTRFSPRPGASFCESNAAQLEACRVYCVTKTYPIRAAYQDTAKSGGTNGEDTEPEHKDRPCLWAAIEDLQKGDILIAHKPDRIARDVYLMELIRRNVKQRGATIETVTGINGEAPQDKFIQQILQAFAEYEREIIRERTKYSMIRYQQQGRLMTSPGHAPYGFSSTSVVCPVCKGGSEKSNCRRCHGRGTVGMMLPVAKEQWVIGQVKAMVAQGETPQTIAMILSHAGYDSIRARPMSGYWVQKKIINTLNKLAQHGIVENNL